MSEQTLAIVLVFPLAVAVVAGSYAFGYWMRSWTRGGWGDVLRALLWLSASWLAVGMLFAGMLRALGVPR